MCTDILADVALATVTTGWTIYEVAPNSEEMTKLNDAKAVADAAADLAEMTSLGYVAMTWKMYK